MDATIADRLIDAYDRRAIIEPITATEPGFDIAAAYDVLHLIEGERHTRGWRPAGRKIGFTNSTIWERYGVDGPMWARVWDRTVIFARDGAASLSLSPFVQPRIEPEIVCGIAASPPASDDAEEVLACVEWIAAGFEIVQCHFADWRFAAPDCTAAFGLHGALAIGTPLVVTDDNRASLASALAVFDVTLRCGDAVVDRGSGANVLGSPALALAHLVRIVRDQPQFAPVAPGEVVTTGTLTDAWPVEAGQRWTSDYGSLGVEGLTISFEA
jgi:2-oxo-3-hexenedioate decarboxylase